MSDLELSAYYLKANYELVSNVYSIYRRGLISQIKSKANSRAKNVLGIRAKNVLGIFNIYDTEQL